MREVGRLVVSLAELDPTQVWLVGGKGAQLGALTRIDGVRAPAGFCVTTRAFARILEDAEIDELLARARELAPEEQGASGLGAELRRTLAGASLPEGLAAAITAAHARLGEHGAYAVRSSATAEDLPTASFAGMHDSYLHVVGAAAILEHIRRCWASLFSERAVAYRLHRGIDPRAVQMAVVVQRMVEPVAAGVLFTADPVSGDRRLAAVEATVGLGEAMVSGLVNPDVFKVVGEAVVETTLAGETPTLTEAQVLKLVELGRRIEAHFGRPQDIEWCLDDAGFQIVQSRPITTLFPIPEVTDDENHVYVSVGHPQMMTDALKPLGLSMWRLTALRPMVTAGGRLFVDVTRGLASPASRAGLLDLFGRSDPLLRDALQTLLDRGFLPTPADAVPSAPPPRASAPVELEPDVVAELIAENQASVAALERDIQGRSGEALLDFILADIQELKRLLVDPRSQRAILAGMEAAAWLNEELERWLGEKNAADRLAQSVAHNVTSQMGLALLDVADAIRPYPAVVAALEQVEDGDEAFLDELVAPQGGREARAAIVAFLDLYGMRCAGEIDITRPRWSERPSTLVPLILGNVANFAAGEAKRRFERGRRGAWEREQELLERLRALPGGDAKAEETKRRIDRLRAFAGYREYPKYGMVRRYLAYKRALLAEAERLAQAGVLRLKEDIFFLSFAELQEVVRTNAVDPALLRRRREEFLSYEALLPPRVLTSDGEGISGEYRRDDLPAGALVGSPVSAGKVEGRARVLQDIREARRGARLEAGDILVTRFTDPSWTPLFVAIAGLVTEVGGRMTHGAVIAREYGLPAVVGVENATRRIRDGQRIRVHGTEGYVELLSEISDA